MTISDQIIQFITANPSSTSIDISTALNAKQGTVVDWLTRLRKAGKVELHGSGRAVSYTLPGLRVAPRSLVGGTLELIQAAGRQGISRQELLDKLGIKKTALDDRIKELRRQKKILPANGKLPGALYYAAGVIPEERPVFVKPVKKPEPLPKMKVVKVIEKRVIPDVIVPDNVKITRVETLGYDPRFQVPLDTKVVGGFASMGIGRYL